VSIRAVIFDFGRVISAARPDALFQTYEAELGIARGTLNQIMFDHPAWQEALVGQRSMEDFWYAVGPALGLTSRFAVDAFRRRYYRDEAVNPDVLGLLRELQGHYRLAVLSNHPAGLGAWLREWKIHDLFEVFFCSGDEGRAKPDPTVYRTTLARLGVLPGEAVFIDDTAGHVAAARAIGIQGIVFEEARQLREDLDAILKAAGPIRSS
jgi:putative hydrolase of the HAD superfamily